MRDRSSESPPQRRVAAQLVTALAFLSLQAWSLQLIAAPDGIALLWLPTGFLVATLALRPPRTWPSFLLPLAVAATALECWLTDRPWAMVASLTGIKMLEATVAALALNRFGGGAGGFRQIGHLVGFTLLCVVGVGAIFGLAGAAVLHSDMGAPFGWVYQAWWTATSLGILVATPLVISLVRPIPAGEAPIRWCPIGWLNITIVLATLAVSVLPMPEPWSRDVLVVLTLPVLLAAAIRHGVLGAVTTSASSVLVSAHATAAGFGPFAASAESTSQAVFQVQLYLITAVAAALFTGLSAERTQATQARLKAQAAFERLRAEALLSLPQLADDLPELAFLQRALSLAEDLTGSTCSFLHFVGEGEAIELVAWSHRTHAGCTANPEFRHHPVAGTGIWADALRRRQTVVINDYPSAAGKRGLPAGHTTLTRMISLPVLEGDQVVMLAGLANALADYTDRDAETAQLIADRTWHVVQRKRAQSALQAREAELTEVQRVARLGSWTLHLDTGRVEGSPMTFELFGLTPAEDALTAFLEQVHPDDRQRVQDALDAAADRTEVAVVTYRVQHEGGLRHIFGQGRAVFVGGTVQQITGTVQDITEQVQRDEQLAYVMHHDGLTGLPNRRRLALRLRDALRVAQQTQRHVAVAVLGLDQFRHINDGLGHAAGDEILRLLTGRLLATLRPGDVLARLGGDEFVMLMSAPEGPADAASAVEALQAAFDEPLYPATAPVRLSAHVGISLYPDDGDTPEALLHNAHAALHQAKADDSSPYQFYTERMTSEARETLLLGNALRGALETDALYLDYQPQFDLRTRRLVGVEALARWRDPGGHPISPARFIPVAERSGLIGALGAWAVRAAIAQARAWLDAGLSVGRVAVNVAGQQLQTDGFVAVVEAALAESRLPPAALGLELTEGFLMARGAQGIDALRFLQAKGIEIAIDDFGTGYSSLSYLKRLPVDKLKIDRAFVSDLATGGHDDAIVAAIVALGRALGLKVIAEGIETDAQAQHLISVGCDEVQGFFFGRPMAPEAIAELARAAPPSPADP